MAEGEVYCHECGNPRGGIVCPVCNTLNDFAFCKQCGTPLTDEAKGLVADLKKLPDYQLLTEMARELEELTAACRKMSETKTGALIVLRHGSALGDILETGDEIDARISRRLIENIFFKNSPLHDGAMILSENRILAARCTLPITQRQDIPPHYGMRHRAAIGMSEVSDASIIVVSEETGGISFVSGGQIKTVESITELRLAIENSYK